MKRTIAKVIAFILLVQTWLMYAVVTPTTVKASDLPVVNEEQVTERIKEMAKNFGVNEGSLEVGDGVLFTANGKACGHVTNKTCNNCFNTNVIKSDWFKKSFGYTVNISSVPGHYHPTRLGYSAGWTCYGFANFALWYVAKENSTSTVSVKLLGTQGQAFTKANLEKSGIRIGDVIRTSAGHSVMFLAFEGDNTIKVLDANWVNNVNDIGRVKIHTMSLSSSVTCAITRAANYQPDYVHTVSVIGVSLDKTSVTLTGKGMATALTATVAPSNATDKSVTWSSSNTSVATVSSNGVVTAVGNGVATITVKTGDGNYTAACRVTVNVLNGLCKVNGEWGYYVNGILDSGYTGICTNEYGKWYVKNGKVDMLQSGLFKINNVWYYVKDNKLQLNYTGLANNVSGTWYVKNGIVDLKTTGLVKAGSKWYYVKDSKFISGYTGFVENDYSTWYVEKGVVNLEKTGLVKVNSKWYYIENSKYMPHYTGLSSNASGIWYVVDGQVDFSQNGLFKISGTWYYVSGNKVATNYTGFAINENGKWYVEKGIVSLKYNGKVAIDGKTYTIVNSKVQ